MRVITIGRCQKLDQVKVALKFAARTSGSDDEAHAAFWIVRPWKPTVGRRLWSSPRCRVSNSIRRPE